MKNFTARVKMMDSSTVNWSCDAENALVVEAAAMEALFKEGKHPDKVLWIGVTSPMKEPYFVYNRSPEDFVIIDEALWDGVDTFKGKYSGETLEQLRTRVRNTYMGEKDGQAVFVEKVPYPTAEIMEWEEASKLYEAAQAAKYIGPVSLITQDRFNYLLEVLPPEDWQRGGSSESFKLMERLSGNITTIAARIGNDYYEFNDNARMTHVAIIEKIAKAIEANTVEDHTQDKGNAD